ncbi:MAG: insulinase family protein [Candidatus Omnitrophica bacterium]|nr:insulinase family protein [Candidatus Omnitrophota bacterium]
MYKKVVMDNGLTVVTANMPGMESISVGVWIRAGGRYENKKNSGISHFLEHMVFKGTRGMSGKALKEAIEGRGGLLNGFTGEEFTCYLAKVLGKNAGMALDVLSDMALNPKLSKTDFEKERMVILEEIKMYMDMPSHYVHEVLAELLWPGQPLGMPLTGTFETVSSMTTADVLSYKEGLYNPKNIVISIAGRIPGFDLMKIIKKRFGPVKSSERRPFEPAVARQTEPAVSMLYKKTEQTHLAIGLRGYDRFSRHKYKLDLMHVILGGNMSSRLFNEVREKAGLAYEISTSVKHYNDTGAFIISAGIDNKKVAGAVSVILDVLNNIKSKGVNQEEFIRAKQFYKGQLQMVFEETMNQMLWLGEKFISGDVEFRPADVLRRVDRVTREDIKTVANDILNSGNISLALIGPLSGKEQGKIRKRLRAL